MLDPNRPIYRNAPLKLVTFQIRFPPVPDLDQPTTAREVVDAMRERYPILTDPPLVDVNFGPTGTQERARGIRLMTRDRTRAVGILRDSLTIETSAYLRYELFAEEIDWALKQVNDKHSLPAVTRLGLRYIDEISMDDATEIKDWRPWIDNRLLDGGILDEYRTREFMAQVVLDVAERQRMTVRYGHVTRPIVDPNGPLRIEDPPIGPYFLLDIDSFWEASPSVFEEYDQEEVQRMCLELHEPIRDIFERATTAELREQFSPEEQA